MIRHSKDATGNTPQAVTKAARWNRDLGLHAMLCTFSAGCRDAQNLNLHSADQQILECFITNIPVLRLQHPTRLGI